MMASTIFPADASETNPTIRMHPIIFVQGYTFCAKMDGAKNSSSINSL
jgi:hypothetical protein